MSDLRQETVGTVREAPETPILLVCTGQRHEASYDIMATLDAASHLEGSRASYDFWFPVVKHPRGP
jgi:hypothetical protein